MARRNWLASQKPTTLVAIRVLALANAVVLTVVGALYCAFAARPGGLVVAGVVWAAAATLFALVTRAAPRRRNAGWRW